MAHEKGWSNQAVHEFSRRAISRVGIPGWEYLSPMMREGLIAAEFAKVIMSNDKDEFAVLHDLYRDMLEAAGCR